MFLCGSKNFLGFMMMAVLKAASKQLLAAGHSPAQNLGFCHEQKCNFSSCTSLVVGVNLLALNKFLWWERAWVVTLQAVVCFVCCKKTKQNKNDIVHRMLDEMVSIDPSCNTDQGV